VATLSPNGTFSLATTQDLERPLPPSTALASPFSFFSFGPPRAFQRSNLCSFLYRALRDSQHTKIPSFPHLPPLSPSRDHSSPRIHFGSSPKMSNLVQFRHNFFFRLPSFRHQPPTSSKPFQKVSSYLASLCYRRDSDFFFVFFPLLGFFPPPPAAFSGEAREEPSQIASSFSL